MTENKSEKKEKSPRSIGTIIAVIILAMLVALSGSLIVYIQQNNNQNSKTNQTTSTQTQSGTPKLVTTPENLQCVDNCSDANAPFLLVTGTVTNVGDAQANNCTVHVSALQDGNVSALATSKIIPSLAAGASEEINLQFPYSGPPLIEYSSYLTWTN